MRGSTKPARWSASSTRPLPDSCRRPAVAVQLPPALPTPRRFDRCARVTGGAAPSAATSISRRSYSCWPPRSRAGVCNAAVANRGSYRTRRLNAGPSAPVLAAHIAHQHQATLTSTPPTPTNPNAQAVDRLPHLWRRHVRLTTPRGHGSAALPRLHGGRPRPYARRVCAREMAASGKPCGGRRCGGSTQLSRRALRQGSRSRGGAFMNHEY